MNSNQGQYLSNSKEEFINVYNAKLTVGNKYRFYSDIHRKYIIANSKGELLTSGKKDNSGIWKVVNGGGGNFAFWNIVHKRFMRMKSDTTMNLSKQINNASLPGSYKWERFQIRGGGGNKVGFWNPTNKSWVGTNDKGHMYGYVSKSNFKTFPRGWTWQRYTPIHVEKVTKRSSPAKKGFDKKCIIFDSPVNKEMCFEIPNVQATLGSISKVGGIVVKLGNVVKKIPEKVKTDVVDPAINGIGKKLKGVIKKMEELVKKIGEKLLKIITSVLIAVVKALIAIFKPLFGIGKLIAGEVWNKVTQIVPFLTYLPYLIVIALTTPIIFFPVIVIFLILSAFTGPLIFLGLPIILIGAPYLLINKAKSSFEDLKSFDFEKFITDIFSNTPALLEGVFNFIKSIIEGIIKKFK